MWAGCRGKLAHLLKILHTLKRPHLSRWNPLPPGCKQISEGCTVNPDITRKLARIFRRSKVPIYIMNVVAGDLTAVHKLMLRDLTTRAAPRFDKVAPKSLETLFAVVRKCFSRLHACYSEGRGSLKVCHNTDRNFQTHSHTQKKTSLSPRKSNYCMHTSHFIYILPVMFLMIITARLMYTDTHQNTAECDENKKHR